MEVTGIHPHSAISEAVEKVQLTGSIHPRLPICRSRTEQWQVEKEGIVKLLGRLTALFLVFSLLSGLAAASDLEGKTAPDFTLKTAGGDKMSLSDALEKGPVLLDFWATWCQPCKQAFPPLSKIYETYSDQGFTMLAISVDNTRSVSKIRPYIRSKGFKFPVLLDTDSQVLRQYGGNNVPHTVLIDQKGQIRKIWIGYHPGEEKEIEEEVVALLEAAKGESDK